MSDITYHGRNQLGSQNALHSNLIQILNGVLICFCSGWMCFHLVTISCFVSRVLPAVARHLVVENICFSTALPKESSWGNVCKLPRSDLMYIFISEIFGPILMLVSFLVFSESNLLFFQSISLINFRKHVRTQNVALLIYERVYTHAISAQLRTIVGVDVKKSFDDVHHFDDVHPTLKNVVYRSLVCA